MPPQQTDTQRQASYSAAGLNPTQQQNVTLGIQSGVQDKNSPIGYQNQNPVGTDYTKINSTSLAPQTPIQMPSQPAPQDYAGAITGIKGTVDAINKSITDIQAQQSQTPQNDPNSLDNLFKTYMASQSAPPSAADQYNTDYAASGIADKQATALASQNKLAAINAQLAGKNYEFNTVIPNQSQQNATGQNGTQAGVQATTVSQQRAKMLEIAPLQLQALVTQAEVTGNNNLLTAAQNHLDTIYKIHEQDAQAQYDLKNKQIDAVYNYASKKEQGRLDQQKQDAQNAFTQSQNDLNNAQDLAKSAIANGQGDLAGKITALDPKSPTYRADLSKLSSQITATKDLQFISGTANQSAGYFDKSTGKFTPLGGGSLDPTVQNDIATLDPTSKSILSQTGLSFFAFKLATDGTTALARMSSSDRIKIANELKTFAANKGVDVSTLTSQYKAQNEVLQNNIARSNNTQIAAQEVSGTIDQFISDVTAADLSGTKNTGFFGLGNNSLKAQNVLDLMAGKQVNNTLATKYSFDIATMANDLASYYAASRSVGANGTVPTPDDADKATAARVIADGLNTGAAQAFKDSINQNEQKVTGVVEAAKTRAQKAVWDLFGVGGNFDTANGKTSTTQSNVSGPIVNPQPGVFVQITD